MREAGSLAEAEAALDAGRPDVVLLDVPLAGEESTSLLERLRAEGIPVALVTGSSDMRELSAPPTRCSPSPPNPVSSSRSPAGSLGFAA